MAMKNIILAVLSIFILIQASGQAPDSGAVANTHDQVTVSETITKYRSLIMDNVLSGNKAKVKTLFDDITRNVDNKNYISLYANEKCMLWLWLNDYKRVTDYLLHEDSLEQSSFASKIYPGQDQLSKAIEQQLLKSKLEVTIDIKNSPQTSDDDKSFLVLFLDAVAPDSYDKNATKEMEKEASRFAKEYPQSPYVPLVRKYFTDEYEFKKFSFGMEMYSGSSMISGDMSDYFSNGGLFGFGLVWGINKVVLNTRFASSSSDLKMNVDQTSPWQSDRSASVFFLELSAGYRFMPLKRMEVSPILGVVWFDASPNLSSIDENPELKDVDISSNASPMAGVELGWIAGESHYYNQNLHKEMLASVSLHLRYEVHPVSFTPRYKAMDGLEQSVVLGLRVVFGAAKKVE